MKVKRRSSFASLAAAWTVWALLLLLLLPSGCLLRRLWSRPPSFFLTAAAAEAAAASAAVLARGEAPTPGSTQCSWDPRNTKQRFCRGTATHPRCVRAAASLAALLPFAVVEFAVSADAASAAGAAEASGMAWSVTSVGPPHGWAER
jgi:hypothetical protein